MATLGNTTATSLTLYGPLNTANNTWNKMGDDSAVGDHNVGGHFCIKGLNNTPGITFFNSSDTNVGALTVNSEFNFDKTIKQNGTAVSLSNHTHSYLPLSGGTVTGTLVLSKTTDAEGTTNNSPALIVGGAATAAHIEIDANEVMAKANGTSVGTLYLNHNGGEVQIGAGANSTVTIGSSSAVLNVRGTIKQSGTAVSLSNHTHSYLPLSGGTLTGDLLFGNSATTTRQLRFQVGDNDYARVAAGATASNAGWMEIATADDANEPIYVRQYSGAYTTVKRTATLLDASGNTSFPGTLTATSVYNAIYNDYAEFFPRGEETEPGDVIALDLDSDKEQYVKSTANNRHHVVGVHSDDYAMIIGGDKGVEMKDNEVKYIPVSLMGRIKVKYIGAAKKGNYVVASEIRGVARAYDKNKDSELDIFGFLLEEDDKVNEVRRLKIKVKG